MGEAAESLQVKITPRVERSISAIGDRDDELRIGIRKVHPYRHDANDPARNSIDAKSTANHIGCSPVMLPPISVAQDDVVVLARDCILCTKKVTQRRSDAQRFERIYNDLRAKDSVRRSGIREI